MTEKKSINGRVIPMEDYGSLDKQGGIKNDQVHIMENDELVSYILEGLCN